MDGWGECTHVGGAGGSSLVGMGEGVIRSCAGSHEVADCWGVVVQNRLDLVEGGLCVAKEG